jgi:hypothetical protein
MRQKVLRCGVLLNKVLTVDILRKNIRNAEGD